MSYDTARPHLAAFVVVRKQGKVAFVLRENTNWMNGYYGMPSGKVEIAEASSSAAIREAKEEIGITIQPEHLKQTLVMHRQEKGGKFPEWIDVYFEVTKWEGEPYNAEPNVHSELAWLDLKGLPENVIPSVKAALAAIERGETYTEYGW